MGGGGGKRRRREVETVVGGAGQVVSMMVTPQVVSRSCLSLALLLEAAAQWMARGA